MISLIESYLILIEKQKCIHIPYIKLHPSFFETVNLSVASERTNTAMHKRHIVYLCSVLCTAFHSPSWSERRNGV